MGSRKVTPKQERFAQAYIELGNASEAYRQAYNASRMKPETINRKATELTGKGMIAARIYELQLEHRKRHDVTVNSLTEDARDAIEFAKSEGKPSAMVSALTLIARLHGLLTDKHEHTGKDGAPLPPTILEIVCVESCKD